MKLALILKHLSTQGGTERFTTGFVHWLLAEGHAVDVWCASADDVPEGAAVRPLQVNARGRIWRMGAIAAAAARVPVDDYDAVLNQVRGPVSGVFRAGGGCHRAWVDVRGWSLADALETHLDRRAVSSAQLVVANSKMAEEDLQHWYATPPEQIKLVRNGVDLQRFKPCSDKQGELDLVFLGSGFARKGLQTAIAALAHLPGRTLTVLGADRRQAWYAQLAHRLGVSERVRFMGAVSRPEELLCRAQALVLPTRYDPSANACLEAMACGIPVATTLLNGAAEILPHQWMAISDPRDERALAEVLQRMLEDRTLGAACRAVAERYPAAGAYQALWRVLEEATA